MNKNFAYDVNATTLENAMIALGSSIPSDTGLEYAINGGFDSDSGWSKEGGWTISSGKAVAASAGSTSTIHQEDATTDLVIGKTYIAKFTISDYSSGGVKLRVGNVYGSYQLFKTDGDHYFEVTPTNIDNNAIGLVGIGSNTTLKIDNFSFKEKATSSSVNSGVYKINDVANMTKAGQWNIQTPTFSRADRIVTTANHPNMASAIIRSGRMILNGNFAGMYDFAYHEGDFNVRWREEAFNKMDAMLFSDKQDTHWSLVYINGDLNLDGEMIIRPPCRKLGMVIYVAGDFVCNGVVSMTDRGANHSGTGTSHGYTAPVAIPLNGTLTIPATGGAGGARAYGNFDLGTGGQKNNGTAAGGSGTGTYCGSGGGGSGEGRVPGDTSQETDDGHYSGKGGDGTCFTGGNGGGGFMWYNMVDVDFEVNTDAVEYGGAGGQCQTTRHYAYGEAPGCGNPGGQHIDAWPVPANNVGNYRAFTYELGEQRNDNHLNAPSNQMRHHRFRDGFAGTAGTCVVMVSGEYSGAGMVRSEGVNNNGYWDGYAGHGSAAGGGGVGIVLYGTDDSGPTPRSNGGVDDNYITAGGEGGNGTGLKAAL